MRAELKLKVLLTGILMFILVCPGFAEQTDNKKEKIDIFDLGQVVVTATRTERAIGNVASSVSLVTRQEVEESNAKNTFDLLRTIPGVCVEDSYGNGMQGRVSLRGFSPFGSKYVLVMVDGVVVNEGDDGDVSWGGSVPALEDVDRIEVVKGPASALYGGNSMGGVINIITRTGTVEPKTRVSFASGTHQAILESLTTGGAVKNINYRFSAVHKEGGGYREHNDYEKDNFALKISWAPDTESDLTFNLHSTDLFYELAGGLTRAEYEDNPEQSNSRYKYNIIDLHVVRGDVTYHREIDDHNSLKAVLFGLYKDYDDLMYFSGVKQYLSDIGTVGAEFQYNLEQPLWEKPNSLVCGVTLKSDDIDYLKYTATGGVTGALEDDNNTEVFSYAFFAQDEFTIVEPLTISLGGRYDRTEYDFSDYYTPAESGKKSFDKFSPKLGLIYKIMDKFSLFANIGQAFKAPTPGKLFSGASSTDANLGLNSEIATNYEIGIKAQPGDFISFKVSGYWMDIDDEIITVDLGGGAFEYQNTGQTCHKGIESEIDWRLMKGLTTYLNGEYQTAKFTDYTYKGISYDDNRIPHTPHWRSGCGLRYEHLIGLSANLGFNFVDTAYADRSNVHKIPSYTVWNTRIDYKKEWWSTYLKVDNLFDEKFFENMSATGKIYPSPGRTVMLGTSVEF